MTVVRETRWTRWAPHAAAIWSLGYGVLGVLWALGVPGNPFGSGASGGPDISLLARVDAAVGAWVVAGFGLGGAVLAMLAARGGRVGRSLLMGATVVAGVLAVGLAVVIPDYRALAAIGYTPIVILGEPFGYPPDVSLADVYEWQVVNQLLMMAGGIVWGLAGLAFFRRQRSGRVVPVSVAAALRWGRWAVAVAVVIPVFYAVTRWAWALGFPLGVRPELLDQLGDGVWAGATLGALAIGGAILTLGLVQRWGEIFPRWLPGLAGRRVPVLLAVVPALLVSLLVTSAGLMFVRLWLTGGLSAFDGNWAALVPELLWPLWGVALAAATLAYWLRRREPRSEHQVSDPSAEQVSS